MAGKRQNREVLVLISALNFNGNASCMFISEFCRVKMLVEKAKNADMGILDEEK